MKFRKKDFLLWGVILLLSLIFRLYKLSSIPYGFHVDEAKAGWNAYSILKTGMDDKGNFLPLYYDSFGDFRPTGLLYLIIPSLAIFGPSIFGVRFSIALIGSLTIFPLIFILNEMFKKNKIIGGIGAFLVSFNPWHIIASRSTSESVVSIFFSLWGIYFLLKTFRNKNFKNVIYSLFFFSISYFFYHNIRVLAPLFVLSIILVKKLLNKQSNKYFYSWLIFAGITIATVVFMSSGEARGRLSQVGLKSDFRVLDEVTNMPIEAGPNNVFMARMFHNKIASYIRIFLEEYREYFSTGFLIGSSYKPNRYFVPQIGLFTYIEFVLFMCGVVFLSKSKKILFVVLLLLLSPLPAAITIEDTPNMQRAIFMIPFMIIIMAFGFSNLSNIQNKFKFLKNLIIFLYFANFIYFWHMYLVHQKMSIASYYRDGGNVELVKKLSEVDSSYEKIYLTNTPDSLYPWLGLLLDKDPKMFNAGVHSDMSSESKYENFIFTSDKCPLNSYLNSGRQNFESILFVDSEGCEDDKKFTDVVNINTVDVIYRPDGSPPYVLKSVSKI